MTPDTPSRDRPAGARRGHTRGLAWRALVLVVAIGVLVLVGDTAFAAVPQGGAVAPDLNTVLNNIRNWIMGIIALLSTVFLSIGGVRYLISNGDPGEINKAKDSLRNAAWGYGLAALAPVVVEILKQIVGG
ncbi:TrbC/VIRB2 family protein [Frankia sp. AiPs1]|uniref:pilin n=1 Tax=Frankia sp. AiPa1 TaxID=573492 RepID=UPI00202B30F7|nr:pilin [Frankia sp. AiPa1]MCL9758663.1 pilin [Frankia sp. AiPa1]